MLLKKIKLNNIRSYESQEIKFPKGSVLLSGDIGSGKTSILLAIEFALFGLQPGQRGSLLLRNGKNEGGVSIEFEIDDKIVIIERTLKRKKTISQDYAAITINNEKQELSVTELKNKVLEILNYPKEFLRKQNLLYKFTVYTPQEEMKQIILQDSETRINTLRHVFGIDKYKKILENSSIVLLKIREEKKFKQGLTKNLKQDKEIIKQKKIKLSSQKQELLLIKDEFILKLENRKKIENELNEIIKKIQEKNKLKQEIEKTNLMIATKSSLILENKQLVEKLNLEIFELEKLKFSESSLKELETELINKKQKLNKITKKIEDRNKLNQEIEKINFFIKVKNELIFNNKILIEKLNLEIFELEKLKFNELKFNELENKIQKKKYEITELNEYNLNITSKICSLELKIKDNDSIKEKLMHIEVCPTCMQDVSKDYKKNVVDKLNSNSSENLLEITKLSKEKKEISKKIVNSELEISDSEKKIQELNFLKIKFKDLEKKQKDFYEINSSNTILEKELFELVEKQKLLKRQVFDIEEFDDKIVRLQIEDLTNKINELKILKIKRERIFEKQKRLNEIEKQNSFFQKDIDFLAKQIDLLKSSIFELNKYEKMFEDKNKGLEKARNQEKIKEINLAELRREIKVFSKSINELEEKAKQTEMIKNKLIYLINLEDWLSKKFIPMISNIEKNVMIALKYEFSKLFSEWFLMLVSESFNVKLNDNFTPVIEQRDYELDYAYLSGGERTAIALAYRLALNQIINSFLSKIKTRNLVILDEPTDGFSEQQLDKMRQVLEQLNFEQLIIVSHEQKIENFVENVIKFRKENGVSVID